MDRQLRESWQRTGAALDAAVAAMPAPTADDMTAYREYRQHNELGLAFDVLVAVAQERQARAECWVALLDAAREMDLTAADETHGGSVAVVLGGSGGRCGWPR